MVLFYLGTGLTGLKVNGDKFHVFFNNFSAAVKAERTVFCINMATVMGPTPPGTGVIAEATNLASSKSTSPTKRVPLFFVGSANEQF